MLFEQPANHRGRQIIRAGGSQRPFGCFSDRSAEAINDNGFVHVSCFSSPGFLFSFGAAFLSSAYTPFVLAFSDCRTGSEMLRAPGPAGIARKPAAHPSAARRKEYSPISLRSLRRDR